MGRYAPLVAASALIVIAGGVALASDTGETIVACVNPNGLTFIVDDVAECGQNETALEWNTQGVPGPKGDQGDPGPTGPAGPEGSLQIRRVWTGPYWVGGSGSITAASSKSASCAPGETILSGGYRVTLIEPPPDGWASVPPSFQVLGSHAAYVSTDGYWQWQITTRNIGGDQLHMHVYALCGS